MRTTTQLRAAIVAVGLTLLAPFQVRAEDVVVFAAASPTNALDEAAQVFERQGGAHAKISYGASSALARQSRAGRLPTSSSPPIAT